MPIIGIGLDVEETVIFDGGPVGNRLRSDVIPNSALDFDVIHHPGELSDLLADPCHQVSPFFRC
jgi:hypothetical protein